MAVDIEDTWVDSVDDEGEAVAWLVGIGSPEDDFATAGTIRSLAGVRRIAFGRRGDAGPLVLETEGDVLHVRIPFGWVSSNHAAIELVPRTQGRGLRHELRDLGSRNGTLVGGQRIVAPHGLRSGEVFEIGRSFWTLRTLQTRSPTLPPHDALDPGSTASPGLLRLHERLHRLAPGDVPILLRGESGTGKRFVAAAIHRASGRPGPFVAINLAGLSVARVEARLWGDGERPGLVEQVDRGTLLLAGLDALDPLVEPRLVGLFGESSPTRILGQGGRTYDVRIIGSSHKDLPTEAPLHARLAPFVTELPPLRQRREDLGLQCRRILRSLAGETHPLRMTTNAFRGLLVRTWPFNVRQLEHTLASGMLLCSTDGLITRDGIDQVLEQDDLLPQTREAIADARSELIRELARHSGDVGLVARALQRPTEVVHRYLERLDLVPDEYRR